MRPIVLALVALVLLPGLAAAASARIDASDLGYTLPLTVLASGDSVVWGSSDNHHRTRDGVNLGDADACFTVDHSLGSDSVPVTFTLVGGALFAEQGGWTSACENAKATAAGVALPYFCVLHPTMRGSLLVR